MFSKRTSIPTPPRPPANLAPTNGAPEHEPLWTVARAAAYLDVSERYLRDTDCPRRHLPGRGPKRQPVVRFVPAEVRAWADGWRPDRAASAAEAA